MLDEIVSDGRVIEAQINLVKGPNGVGKTTFASNFPKALILDLENGSKHLNVKRVVAEKMPTLADFRMVLKELVTAKHNYETVVIDSVEALESLIADGVCAEGKVTSIEKYDGGYGKGHARTREIMREIMQDLWALKARGVTSVLVGHVQVKPYNDPTLNQAYDRIVMRCNDKMASIIRDLSDNVFYATYKVVTTEEKGKTKAYGDGQRVMYTQWRAGWDAKNRLELPFEIPFSYDAFDEACLAGLVSADSIVSDIQGMMSKLDAGMKEKVEDQLKKYAGNPAKLREIKTRLQKYVTA